MPVVQKQSPKAIKRPTKSSVLDRIQKGVAFDEDEGIKIVLYGRSGSGKTTLWSSFPKPILAIICSGGMKPGELRSIPKEHRKGIHPVVIESSSEFKELLEHQAASEEYKTVVLDHVTGFQDKVLAEVLGIEDIPAQKGWGLASQQDYGQMSLQCKQLFRQAFSLSCNVVFVGQDKENNVDSESEILTPYVGIALSPSLAGWLYPAADYVCHTFIRPETELRKVTIGGKPIENRVKTGKSEYCLRVGTHEAYITKFRCPKGKELPDVIVDPDYDKIMEIINS